MSVENIGEKARVSDMLDMGAVVYNTGPEIDKSTRESESGMSAVSHNTNPEGVEINTAKPESDESNTDLFSEITIRGIDLSTQPEIATLRDCQEYARVEKLNVYKSDYGGNWMRYYYTSTGMTIKAIMNTSAITDFEKLLLLMYTKSNSFKKADNLEPEDIERAYTQKILIKKILQDKGFTIRDLAVMLESDPSTVSKNMSNGYTAMNLDTFSRYIGALGYRLAVIPKRDRTPHKGFALETHPNENSELLPFFTEPPGRNILSNTKQPLGIPEDLSLSMGGGV